MARSKNEKKRKVKKDKEAANTEHFVLEVRNSIIKATTDFTKKVENG